jgi:hypothetical protein
MQCTYAVTWQEEGDPACSGKLELEQGGLRLEGPGTTIVPYAALRGMGFARAGERLGGRPTLVLFRSGSAGSIKVAGVAAPGIVSEIAELLALLHLQLTPSPGGSEDSHELSPEGS